MTRVLLVLLPSMPFISFVAGVELQARPRLKLSYWKRSGGLTTTEGGAEKPEDTEAEECQ